MPRRTTVPPPVRPADLPPHAIPEAIRKLERRLRDFEQADPESHEGSLYDLAESLCAKLDGTLAEIFGPGTLEYEKTRVSASVFDIGYAVFSGPVPRHEVVRAFKDGQATAVSRIKATLELLSERMEDAGETSAGRASRAFRGLELHLEIERRAGQLFRDGHYAEAVEAACKALNALVKLRSGRDDLDGASLMQTVFSVKAPVLAFNDLKDDSDRSEQQGMMHLFAGAMLAFRNPRAHKFVEDHPEAALEYIQFASMLAKLLDRAK